MARLILACVVVLAALLGRAIHLGADPPNWYLTEDLGYHIDDGYKTLAPKNLALFGDSNWNEQDHYSGWMESSPLTQVPYLIAFRTFGVELVHARIVTLAYFALFVVAVGAFCTWSYGALAAVVGLVLLAIDPALFNFSRTALFETAIAAVTYTGLFLAARLAATKPLVFIGILAVTGLVTAHLVKTSGLLYVLPPIGVLTGVVLARRIRTRARLRFLLGLALIGSVVMGVLVTTRNVWLRRLDLFGTLEAPQYLLFTPLPELSPLLLPMGLVATVAILRRAPRALVRDYYALTLASILVLVPLALGIMYNNPPRYHVPVIPAGVLLAVHWMFRYRELPREPRLQEASHRWLAGTLEAVLTAFAMVSVYLALDAYVADQAHWGRHLRHAGYAAWLVGLALLAGGALAFGHWWRRRTLELGALLAPMAVTHVVVGIMMGAVVLARPNYESEAVLEGMRAILEPGESVTGAYAPYLTASSDIPSLWLHPEARGSPNHPCDVHLIRPDYFISNSFHDVPALEYLRANPLVELGVPFDLGSFYRRRARLYRLTYPDIPRDEGEVERIRARCMDALSGPGTT